MEKKRKLIDLPQDVARDLAILAAASGVSVKVYMEQVLATHAGSVPCGRSVRAVRTSLSPAKAEPAADPSPEREDWRTRFGTRKAKA